MKRILAVIGSPRRNGNTHILVSKIVEGAKAKGAVVDELFLGDLNIRAVVHIFTGYYLEAAANTKDWFAGYSKRPHKLAFKMIFHWITIKRAPVAFSVRHWIYVYSAGQ